MNAPRAQRLRIAQAQVGVDAHVRDQPARTGVLRTIGEDNVFVATPQLGEALNRAIAAAHTWLGQPPVAVAAGAGLAPARTHDDG